MEWLKKIITFLISLTVALVLGEIFLRLIAPLPSANHHQLFCEFDPQLGWVKTANFTGTHHTEEYEVTESFNSKGLRGPEYAYAKPGGTSRIMVLGDSYVEAYMVDYEETLTQVCESNLQESCDSNRYEVINTGTGGYATDQELLFYQTEGKKYQPDVTVLLVCINDIWFNNQPSYWRGLKPLFTWQSDSLALTNVPLSAPEDLGIVARFKRWSLENIQLARRLKILKDKIQMANAKSKVPQDLQAYQRRYDPAMTEAWQITEHLFRALQRETQSINSRLIIGFIPEKEAIYPEAWEAFKKSYEVTDEAYDPLRLQRLLQGFCQQHNVPFFDPTPALKSASQENASQPLYYEFDSHWNAAGMKVVGEALANFIGC